MFRHWIDHKSYFLNHGNEWNFVNSPVTKVKFNNCNGNQCFLIKKWAVGGNIQKVIKKVNCGTKWKLKHGGKIYVRKSFDIKLRLEKSS